MSQDLRPRATGPGLFGAAEMVEWRLRATGQPLRWLNEAAVFTHQGPMLRRRRPWSRPRAVPGLSFDTLPLPGGRGAVTFIGCRGVGGPATAIAVEEAAVAGVRRLVAVDLAGSIDPALPSGEVVLVEAAFAADGTSEHYNDEPVIATDEALTAALSERLTRRKLPFTTGRVWSTDAAYRETRALISYYGSEGAVAVDMDTAALLAVCSALGIEVAVLLVLADELHEAWHPPRNLREIRAKLRRLAAEAAACLRA